MRFHDRADVRRQRWLLLFATSATARGKVLQALNPKTRFVQSLVDRRATPAKALFGLTGIARAQFRGHLGHEQTPLVSFQPPRPRTKQRIETVRTSIHDAHLP